MRALASYILRGPMQATLVAVLCAMLSLLIPPTAYLAGAVVALVTLRVGGRQGITAVFGATIGVGLIAWLVLPLSAAVAFMLAAAFALTVWLPVWLVSSVLRSTQSLALALQAAALFGVVVVVGAFWVLGDPASAWHELLDKMKPVFVPPGASPNADQVYGELIARAPYMTGYLAASLVLGVVVSLLVGRAWQAMLFNPGGLRNEFNGLRYGTTAAVIALAVAGFAGFTEVPLLTNIVIVLVLAYVFQGLGVVHGLLARLKASGGWLVGIYVLLLLPMVVELIALLGFADTWLDFRARFGRKHQL
jgi:hypothetical protein